MPKIYYFSENKLKIVELKKTKLKSAVFAVFSLILTGSLLVFGLSYFGVLNTEGNVSSIKNENALLLSKLQEITSKYQNLNAELDSLITVNNDLRIAANLPPLEPEDRTLGKGGSISSGLFDFLSSNNKKEIQASLSFIDEVEKKLEFEKNNFIEIANTLKSNQELYRSIPAIKPCAGTLALHGFGMRLHPILNVRRMHEGIDIITPVGTPVYASADGEVVFAGRNSGYGLMVEIDHGFGYRTIYAHLSSVQTREGAKIKRGTFIAKTGNTGLSTGPHLHYEIIHNGVKLNPEEFMFDSSELFITDISSARNNK
ncbi:MAG: M23 family metallopeptidase [Ignavibacteriales bacterium]|nr:MAG: M23 family metallopeptidase [Ignavibacteriales bacterium]